MAKICSILVLAVILSFATALDTVWTVRYNGPANLQDRAHDIALDGSENVYVTGGSQAFDERRGYDYLTIKYNPSGNTVWTKRNGFINFYDEAYGVAIDNDSNWVYVTGNQTDSYFYTIKYNLDGDTIWTRGVYPYHGIDVKAQAIDLDKYGYAYITGYYNRYDLRWLKSFTVKYNPSGDTIWSDSYPQTAGTAYAYGIAADTLGFIFVTGGEDFLTIKYTSTGSYVWAKTYDIGMAQGVAIDQTGNVYSTGYITDGANYDCLTIKCNSDGDTIWTRIYHNAQGLSTKPHDIAVDSLGGVYIAGVRMGGPGTSDYLIIKYNSDGDTIWTTTYNALSNDDIAYGITVNDSGYIYVTGASMNSANYCDYLTIKYYDNTYSIKESASNNSTTNPIFYLFPNPTSSPIAIHYNLRKESNVAIKIYDVTGKMVKSICHGNQKTGGYAKYWDGMTTENTRAPAGVYFCRIESDNFSSTAKFTLVR